VVALAPRARARRLLRSALPRRLARVVLARTPGEFARMLHEELVDAAVVDLQAGDAAWQALTLARTLPSVPFFVLAAPWPGDAAHVGRAAGEGDVVDVFLDGVDDAALAALMAPHRLTRRFATALREPPPQLQLGTPAQRAVWRRVLARAWRPLTTATLAADFGVSREHLSRTFASGGAPTLKRVIDLVRVCLAAELAKNPAHDVGDVARLLGFASASHLAVTTQRVVGTRPSSLARLRTVDLVERFVAAMPRHAHADRSSHRSASAR
jgi:AraC-like DNA-binding protein